MSVHLPEVGTTGSFTKVVDVADNEAFGDISGDYNPLHFDDDAAQRAGFEHGRVSNGFVTESKIAGALVQTFGTKEHVVFALEKNTRFLQPVYMGDEITAVVTVTDRLDAIDALRICAECFNQNREKVSSTQMVVRLLPLT